jgi:FixJ family two-component response regulator
MRGLQGHEVVRELRTLDPDARVVLMSGFSEKQAMNDFSTARPGGFLGKPFRADGLLDVVIKSTAP